MNACNAINLHATYFRKPIKQAIKIPNSSK